MVTEITAKTFASKVLKSNRPVLVEVWALWCKPCQAMAPVLEDVSKQFAGQAVVVKLNAEQNQELVRQYSVIGIPTLLFFSHGRLVDRKTGLQSAQAIARRLTPLLHFSADEAAGREITGLFRLPARPHMWLAAALGITAMLGAAWFWLY